MATLAVKIVGDSSSLERSFKRANASASGFTKSMTGTSTVSKRTTGVLKGMGGTILRAG